MFKSVCILKGSRQQGGAVRCSLYYLVPNGLKCGTEFTHSVSRVVNLFCLSLASTFSFFS